MGVRLIQSILKAHHYYPKRVRLSNREQSGRADILVVDGPGLFELLFHDKDGLDYIRGGQWDLAYQRAYEFVKCLNDLGLKVHVCFDGAPSNFKGDVLSGRMMDKVKKNEKLMSALSTNSYLLKSSDPIPPGLSIGLRNLFTTLFTRPSFIGNCVVHSIGEGDQECAAHSLQVNAFAVLSNDSDFLFYSGLRWMNLRDFPKDLQLVPDKVLDLWVADDIARHLVIPPERLSLLACLTGNDYLNTPISHQTNLYAQMDTSFHEALQHVKQTIALTIPNAIKTAMKDGLFKHSDSSLSFNEIASVVDSYLFKDDLTPVDTSLFPHLLPEYGDLSRVFDQVSQDVSRGKSVFALKLLVSGCSTTFEKALFDPLLVDISKIMKPLRQYSAGFLLCSPEGTLNSHTYKVESAKEGYKSESPLYVSYDDPTRLLSAEEATNEGLRCVNICNEAAVCKKAFYSIFGNESTSCCVLALSYCQSVSRHAFTEKEVAGFYFASVFLRVLFQLDSQRATERVKRFCSAPVSRSSKERVSKLQLFSHACTSITLMASQLGVELDYLAPSPCYTFNGVIMDMFLTLVEEGFSEDDFKKLLRDFEIDPEDVGLTENWRTITGADTPAKMASPIQKSSPKYVPPHRRENRNRVQPSRSQVLRLKKILSKRLVRRDGRGER